jgi:hypothetical protein
MDSLGYKALGSLKNDTSRTILKFAESIQENRAERTAGRCQHAPESATSAAKYNPEADNAKDLEDYHREKRAARLAGARLQFEQEKAEWKAYSPDIQAEFIRYEKESIAWDKDHAAPMPRRPDLGHVYYDLDYLRYVAPEHFTDEERAESLQPPEPEKPELEPPADGAGYELAPLEKQPVARINDAVAAGAVSEHPITERPIAPDLELSGRHWGDYLMSGGPLANAALDLCRTDLVLPELPRGIEGL